MTHVRDLFDLSGRVALITGGSRGLGLEMAHGLGEAGASVTITGRRPRWLEPAEAELRAAGIHVQAAECDVTDSEAVEALVDRIVDEQGRIDILINNAGISWGAPAEDMAPDRFRAVLDTNISGAFLVAQAVGRRMIQQGGGVLLNTASVAGLAGVSPSIMRAAGYHASKGALIALTRQLAVEWAPHGIRVNALAPGFFPSRMSEGVIAQHEEEMRAAIPMRRLGGPDEIKGAALFLVSDAARYVTGQVLVVDGGALAW
ncbi:MAG TPA: SDR family oxidoreductase [Chloroflexota bacterium]|nr:SDR family oxidoreductase [Chloroflexota bacterium]